MQRRAKSKIRYAVVGEGDGGERARLQSDDPPDALRGVVVTGFLFVVGQFAIAECLGRAAIGSAYGAAGSLLLVLVWVYYSALIVLFGAVLTWRLSRWRHHAPPPEMPAPALA